MKQCHFIKYKKALFFAYIFFLYNFWAGRDRAEQAVAQPIPRPPMPLANGRGRWAPLRPTRRGRGEQYRCNRSHVEGVMLIFIV